MKFIYFICITSLAISFAQDNEGSVEILGMRGRYLGNVIQLKSKIKRHKSKIWAMKLDFMFWLVEEDPKLKDNKKGDLGRPHPHFLRELRKVPKRKFKRGNKKDEKELVDLFNKIGLFYQAHGGYKAYRLKYFMTTFLKFMDEIRKRKVEIESLKREIKLHKKEIDNSPHNFFMTSVCSGQKEFGFWRGVVKNKNAPNVAKSCQCDDKKSCFQHFVFIAPYQGEIYVKNGSTNRIVKIEIPSLKLIHSDEINFWINSPICREKDVDEELTSGDVFLLEDRTRLDNKPQNYSGITYISDNLVVDANNDHYTLSTLEEAYKRYNINTQNGCEHIFGEPDIDLDCKKYIRIFSCTDWKSWAQKQDLTEIQKEIIGHTIDFYRCQKYSEPLFHPAYQATSNSTSLFGFIEKVYRHETAKKLSPRQRFIWESIRNRVLFIKDQLPLRRPRYQYQYDWSDSLRQIPLYPHELTETE